MIDISIEKAFDANGADALMIKFQSPILEVNIWLAIAELDSLIVFLHSQNDESLQIGNSANAKTFWRFDDENLYVLIGNDPEIWDICLTLDRLEIQELKTQLNERL